MKIVRSPELNVLLMSCALDLSAEKKIQLSQFLSQHQIDWDHLYTLANRHRVIPFLYRTLQALPSIPAKLLTRLQHECRIIATDNMLKLHEYHRIKRLLDTHEIAHVAFKGVYLSENNYPDSSLRSIGDLDILVEKNILLEVIQLLESDQYQLGYQYKHYLQYNKRTLVSDLQEVSLIKPFFNKSYFDIDLHWEIDCLNNQYASFGLQDIFIPPGLFKEHQIILLVVHHGVNNIWQKIIYVNDLYFSLNDEDINWAWLLQELRQYGLERVFLVGVYWCQQIWNLPLPSLVEELIDSEQVRSMAVAYEENWEAEDAVLTTNSGLRQVAFFTSAQTQFTKKLKIYAAYIGYFVFRSSLIKIGRYRFYMPRRFGFLTVFFRIIYGVYKSLTISG
ncbi:nucleotidyltransferase domain-containing protein [Spirosoma jeollabukense]